MKKYSKYRKWVLFYFAFVKVAFLKGLLESVIFILKIEFCQCALFICVIGTENIVDFIAVKIFFCIMK